MDESRSDLDFSRVVLESAQFDEVLGRLVNDLRSSVDDVDTLALVGVRTRGVPLAKRLQSALNAQTDLSEVCLGALDITLYRDDVFQGLAIPEVGVTQLPFEVDGKCIVLVDDVLYTGRTVRAALDAIMDFGRPKWIRLLVLVDRGHRELPVQSDYCGITITTSRDESVQVRLAELDGEDRVAVFQKKAD